MIHGRAVTSRLNLSSARLMARHCTGAPMCQSCTLLNREPYMMLP